MDILLGVGVLAATCLLFALGYGGHRRTVPAGWTKWPGASMLISVALVLMGPVGLGFLVKAATMPAYEMATLSLTGLAIVAALVVLAVVCTPLLMSSARQGAGGSATRPVATA